MNALGDKIKLVNRLQTEMEHRRKIEDEAEQMIIDGKFLEATELLQSLDDNLIKDLLNELSESSGSEYKIYKHKCERKSSELMDMNWIDLSWYVKWWLRLHQEEYMPTVAQVECVFKQAVSIYKLRLKLLEENTDPVNSIEVSGVPLSSEENECIRRIIKELS